MKNKILYLIASATLLVSAGCSKKFLEEMKPYDKYGEEQTFSNEGLTSWYIDRMYAYFFKEFSSPMETLVGSPSNSRSQMTEELGGTVSKYLDPTRTLELASDGEAYYGSSPGTSVPNNPYTRIRFCNMLLTKIDEVGQRMSETFRNNAKGQMYMMRAMQYFDLVRVYGGVPLIKTVQNASATDESIRIPRSTSSECFEQIVSDLDSAAILLPMRWPAGATNYGRLTAAAALAVKSRVLLTAASPLFNKDWDNPGSEKWQRALQASLDAENKLSAAGYGLYGSNAKDWASMTLRNGAIGDDSFNSEAIILFLFSNTSNNSAGYNNDWENSIRPPGLDGTGGIAATKEMLDLFPMANGSRPTTANGYDDTYFFADRDPRFYRTFAFSGSKWGMGDNDSASTWFYRWRELGEENDTATVYYGNNQFNSPALVRKMTNPAAAAEQYQYSNTSIFEYRYAELLLNIAECYAATGDVNNAVTYLGKIRARVGIPTANNYGIGTPADKYAAIEACLYERRVELAYEGKRFWDIQRWMLYDNAPESGNSVQKLRVAPINGTARHGYYWQIKTPVTADPIPESDRVMVDPDSPDFPAQIEKLKEVYNKWFVRQPLDQEWDMVSNAPVTILFRPNYYLSGISGSVLSNNPWIEQTKGWMDYNGIPGTFDYQQ